MTTGGALRTFCGFVSARARPGGDAATELNRAANEPDPWTQRVSAHRVKAPPTFQCVSTPRTGAS